jgi:carbon monoxide dehydrogenase subunit G
MQLSWQGTREVAAPIARIWSTLLDPQAIARCAGADDGARLLPDGRYAVTTRIGILFLKLPITLEVEMHDLDAPNAGKMRVRGTGPGTGLEGRSTVHLQSLAPDRTRLHWTAETTVHGRLAEFGATLVEPIIRHTIEEFWNDFAKASLR